MTSITEATNSMDIVTVKACPQCFNRVLNSCHHDGHDVSSVSMHYDEWKQKRIDYLDYEIDEAEEVLERMEAEYKELTSES